MKELLSLKLHCKQQRLACSHVQKAGCILFGLNGATGKNQALWLKLTLNVFEFCRIQRHYSQMLRPDHSVCWRQDQRWKFSHRKKWRFNFRDYSGYSTKGRSSPDAYASLLHSIGVSLNVSDFFLLSFWPSWTRWRLNFFLPCQCCHFLTWSVFDGLLMTFWLIT